MKYFVLVENPSNGALFPLKVADEDCIATWPTFTEADAAGRRNFFGSHGHYAVYRTDHEVIE